ncbi:MAG: hypothetical protein Q4C23_00520 [Mycoplasmatota bacterium]|nr:hypothetical protein [Mycoplasmatota bacterium]
MPDKKHAERAILIYFGVLLLMVISHLIRSKSVIDLVYLVVVVSCVLKFFIIVRDNKE